MSARKWVVVLIEGGLLALAGCGGSGGPTPSGPTEVVAAPAAQRCPSPESGEAVLVDASHDGGVWWSPQSAPFDPAAGHQGLALATYLRGRGYRVDELGHETVVTRERLLRYPIVVRAGNFGSYASDEISAYVEFASCPRTLVLLGEFLGPGQQDLVAEAMGVSLVGLVRGNVTSFTPHPITQGVSGLPYIAGSFVATPDSGSVQVLGRLGTGEAVMGIAVRQTASKVFFIGDTNVIEMVPQPLVGNLVAWGF